MAGAVDAAEVVIVVRGTLLWHLLLLLRPWRSSEVGVLTTHAVAVLVAKHRAERHSSADLVMLLCAEVMLVSGDGGRAGEGRAAEKAQEALLS